MIIGQFCESYPPHIDGVGMVVRSYCEELSALGHTCFYIAPKNAGRKYENAAPETFPVMKYASLPIPNEAYSVGLPAFDLAFLHDLNLIPFDIVHAHTPFVSAIESLMIAKERHIPLVATLHSKYYDDILSKTHSELIADMVVQRVVLFFEKCDEVWTVNDATAEVLRGYGFKGEIIIMPNGTNLWYPTEEDAKKAEMRYDLGRGNVFLFVGQQNFKKNTDSIIKAAAIYKQTGADFKIVFAGQGPDAEHMRALSRELGLSDEAVFTGHIADREILKGLYARADLFVFPSLYDNAPMVVREAAAAGTPSLLIRGSCAADGVTDGVNGFLCENTPEDIAACMKRALLTARSVGARARETIPVPWSGIAKQVFDRYAALIERKKMEISE
ncbi:MAG: glycosyltransferase [Clostridia bacterium]|nr:glycosyltransferase [Clostridia bacterium]